MTIQTQDGERVSISPEQMQEIAAAIVPPVVQAPIDHGVLQDIENAIGGAAFSEIEHLLPKLFSAPKVATVPSEPKHYYIGDGLDEVGPFTSQQAAWNHFKAGMSDYKALQLQKERDITFYAAPSPTEQASDVFAAKRLRRVAVLAGVADAVPQDDAQLLECMGSVLGMIARKLEGETSNVQDEYEAFREWYEKEAPVEGEVSEIDMARHGWLAGRRSTEFTPLKSATPADKGNAP